MKEIVETDIPQIRKLLRDVLQISNFKQLKRLGGLTNHTYQVVLENDQALVVRLPGEGTEDLINRGDEKISTKLACDLEIDAQLLHFGTFGEKITCYIDGAQTLSAASFSDNDILKKVAEVFRVLHTSGVDTHIPFDVFDMAAGYEIIIRDNCVALFDDYEEVKSQILKIRNYAGSDNIPVVPCHNDPLCENWVLDKYGKLYLIDWEYAGMNDGMWDLADVSIEAGLSSAQDYSMLCYYLGREANPKEITRFLANKLYLDFLWALWGKARVPFDGEPMEAYAQGRYTRLKENLDKFLHKFSVV